MANQKGLHFRIDLLLPVLMALALTFWGFYLDEGKYTFEGLFQPGNLIFLMMYALLFFGFQQAVKTGLEYFIGTGKSQRIISGALASLSLPLTLAVFFWTIKPD